MSGQSETYSKPLPALDGLTKEFYNWCRRGDLRFQRCSACQAWRHVPRPICAACGSFESTWQRSSGRGTVFSWTVAERPMHPAFRDDAPYAPVIIEMEEGVRLVTEMLDCPPDELEIGMPVELVLDHVTPEITLPKFKRA